MIKTRIPIVSSILVFALVLSISNCAKKKEAEQTKKPPLPQQVSVKMPDGTTLGLVRVPGQGAKPAPPDGVQMVIKGKVKDVTDEQTKTSAIVIQTETGDNWVAANPPFVNTLKMKAIGKTVKVKGISISKTSFKNFPAIFIKDILEVK